MKAVRRERFVSLDIMITLSALETMAFFYYGSHALAVGLMCMTASLAVEIVSLRLVNRKFTADNLSCVADGLVTALMFSAVMDYRLAVVGTIFGAVIKNVFGGRENMIFSASAVSYVFLLTSWKNRLLQFPQPHTLTGVLDDIKISDLTVSASHEFNSTGKFDFSDFEILLGNFSGPCGAVSILLLIISAVILILRRDISAGAFTGFIGGTVLMACVYPVCGSVSDSVKYTLCTNMVLFSAVYIISDRRISPENNISALIYGFFISVFSYTLTSVNAQENAVVTVSLLLTPLALFLKNVEGVIKNNKNNRNIENKNNKNIEDDKNSEGGETSLERE